MFAAERGDLELEERRRLIRRVGARLEALLGDETVGTCLFAAGSEINRQLMNSLSPRSRAKITANISSNLLRTDKAELLQRF